MMDKRSWPWKKKMFDKKAAEKAAATPSDSPAAASEYDKARAEKAKQEATKKPKYVQISMESYTHLTGLEDQVKLYEEQIESLEDEVNELNEKLTEDNTEMTNKENLVKQHTKVAEEAVSGWEKAEAEAIALKNQLESVTLLKLTAEDRAFHLDGALKECMHEIRNLKEDHEQKRHELILNKQKLVDKIKLDFAFRIADMDRGLLHSSAENAALSRSLQECSNTLVELREEKSRAQAEIETLKINIVSWEKEVGSLKYELDISRKEVEIRSEEKEMCVRSAEVANRHHLEGAKKIAKLEAECQRLRGLVRKKLPGPAALAQMKLEVESPGLDYGEPRFRRSPVKPPAEFALDASQKYIKENEVLTQRLVAMEEETRLLKDALAKRNSEAQIHAIGKKSCSGGKRLSFASMSEDRNDDSVSCSELCNTTSSMSSDILHLEKEKNVDSPFKSESVSNHLDLMDDFLEMEKLAYLSNGSNGVGLNAELFYNNDKSGSGLFDKEALVELQSKISSVLLLISGEKDIAKIVEGVRPAMHDIHKTLLLLTHCYSKISNVKNYIDIETISQELQIAITQIYDFIAILGKEAMVTVPGNTPNREELDKKLETFSAKYSEAIYSNINLIDFVLDISRVLNEARELHFNVLGFKDSELETGSSDCIDKIALPEKKPDVNPLEERCSARNCVCFSDSSSSHDVPNNANLVPTSESMAAPWKRSLEECEQLKVENYNLRVELGRCMGNFENTKFHLLETEQILGEVRLQLTLAEKSNSLAETQLKCMAESYKSLETRADELKKEVGGLQEKTEVLEREVQKERTRHQEALERYRDLQEPSERMDCSEAAENVEKTSQEHELAAAAGKLAECQETIFLLGQQLRALRPQTDTSSPPNNTTSRDVEPIISSTENFEPSETDTVYFHRARSHSESPMDPFSSSTYTPSDGEPNNPLRSSIGSKQPNHRPTKSGSSSASSTPTKGKHARGFSRFFSAKGRKLSSE